MVSASRFLHGEKSTKQGFLLLHENLLDNRQPPNARQLAVYVKACFRQL